MNESYTGYRRVVSEIYPGSILILSGIIGV